MRVWLLLSPAFDDGGWVVHGVFSTKERALEFADSLEHTAYISWHYIDSPMGTLEASKRERYLAPVR